MSSSSYPAAHALICTLSFLAGSLCFLDQAKAATRVVANCNDSGPGSLRDVILGSMSGDVVDLRPIGCSRLLLTTGALLVPQPNLTLIGPGRYVFTIDGNRADRVFVHEGVATLRLERMSIANGRRIAAPISDERGGCIRSMGNVDLHHVSVHHCLMHADGFNGAPPTNGGGISAWGNVHLTYSSVFGNTVTDGGTGGGIYCEGDVTLYRSQIYDNYAYETGGVHAQGSLVVTYSRIYRNRATFGGGGLSMGSDGRPSDRLLINKSTVSNNVLDDFVGRNVAGTGGGMVVYGSGLRTIRDSTFSGNRAYLNSAADIEGEANIYNSTIAYNTEIQTRNQTFPSAACEDRGALRAYALRLESTIVGRNGCAAGAAGFDIAADTGVVIGQKNLIERPRVPVPADTLALDPRLAPLADNGGHSATHMPLADSPVLQRGHNLFGRQYDQRGPGFPRVKGGLPDIGSTER